MSGGPVWSERTRGRSVPQCSIEDWPRMIALWRTGTILSAVRSPWSDAPHHASRRSLPHLPGPLPDPDVTIYFAGADLRHDPDGEYRTAKGLSPNNRVSL